VIYIDGIRVCWPTVSHATLEVCTSTFWHFEQLFFAIPVAVGGSQYHDVWQMMQLFVNFATSVQRMRHQVHINFQDSFSKMNPSVLDKVFGRWCMITDTSFARAGWFRRNLRDFGKW